MPGKMTVMEMGKLKENKLFQDTHNPMGMIDAC